MTKAKGKIMMTDDFASRLRRLRREAGLTQDELGDRLEVGRSSIANWERGLRAPSPLTIRSLALLFNVSSDYLYGRTSQRRRTGISLTSEIDLSRLNNEGVRMLTQLYRLLVNDESYMAEKLEKREKMS